MPHVDNLSDTAAQTADEAASAVTDKARETVALAEKTARAAMEDQRNATSQYVSDLSTAAFAAAHSLENAGRTRSSEYASATARVLDDAGYKLSSYDVSNLVDDAANLVRRNPGLSAAVAAVAGYSLVKLASRERKDSEREY